MTFEQALVGTDRGATIVCNLLDALDAGLLDHDIVVEFLNLWREAWNIIQARSVANATDVLAASIDQLIVPAEALTHFGLSTARDYRFLKPVSPPDYHLGTVKLAGHVEKMLSVTARTHLEKEGFKFPFNASNPGAARDADDLMNIEEDDRVFAIGDMGLDNRIIWVTTEDALDAAFVGESHDDLADPARSVLGLVHRQKGDVMMQVRVPKEGLSGRRMARPTFLDGVNSRFTSMALEAQTHVGNEWGATFDLRALLETDRWSAGAPEQICDGEPVSGFVGLTSQFRPLGVAKVPLGDTHEGIHDDRFFERRRRHRDRPKLEAALDVLR